MLYEPQETGHQPRTAGQPLTGRALRTLDLAPPMLDPVRAEHDPAPLVLGLVPPVRDLAPLVIKPAPLAQDHASRPRNPAPSVHDPERQRRKPGFSVHDPARRPHEPTWSALDRALQPINPARLPRKAVPARKEVRHVGRRSGRERMSLSRSNPALGGPRRDRNVNQQ